MRSRPTDAYTGGSLASAYPEVASRFAAGDADPRLLAVKWNTGTETITLSRAAAVPAADYEEIRLYYRAGPDNTAGSTLSVRASDGATLVAERSIDVPAGSSWGELVVPLPETSSAVISRIDMEIATDSPAHTEGEILLDELSFWGPRATVGSIATARLEWRPAVELSAGDTTLVSDVSVEQRLAAQTASFPDDLGSTRSGIESSTELGARLLVMDTTVGLDLIANQLGTGRQLRHEVSLPIARGVVTIRDGFRAGYGLIEPGTTHETGVQARIGALGSAEAAWLSDQRAEGRVEWSAGAKAEAHGASGVRSTASARVELQERDDPAGQPPSYAAAWAQSFARLAPAEGPQSRVAATGLSATVQGPRAGVELDTEAGFGVDAESRRRRVDTRLAIGIPVAIGESIDATLRLSREARVEAAGVPLAAPGDDVGAAGSILAAHPLPVAFVPIAELLAPDYPVRTAALTEGLLSARYRPKIAIELRRKIRSSAWSLVVPTGVDLSAARPAERDLAAARTFYELTARSVFVAPNLFGRLGTRSIFGFYDTDEFRTSVRVSSVGGDGAPWKTEIDYDQTVRLIWLNGRSVSIETFVSTVLPTYNETLVTHRITHTRTVATEALSGLPLPAFLADSDRRLRHETSLEVDYDSNPADRVLVRVEHGTSLLFGEKGSIRLHGGFGAGAQTIDTESSGLFGVRVGIEGRLSL